MARCRVDKSLTRVEVEGISFPLGVYPVEEMKPKTGYTLAFEPADGSSDGIGGAGGGGGIGPDRDSDDEGGLIGGGDRAGGGGDEWEEWPDRYVFDIFVSANRVEALCRALFAMLPGRVYPILDVLGHDEYREVDPYVAYELVSQERFLDAVRRFRAFFFEDGLVGFGVMSEEPFMYAFVDEHKIVTVRVETDLREKVETLLAAFDLAEVEEIAGADAATHEHRGVLDSPEDRPDLLTSEEIVEDLREEWGLVLNIDPESNTDDEGNELGICAWRCIARHEPNEDPPEQANGHPPPQPPPPPPSPSPRNPTPVKKVRYAEVYVAAESFATAERLLWEAMETLTGEDRSPDAVDVAVSMDRIRPETLDADLESIGLLKKNEKHPALDEAKVLHVRWLD